MIVKQSIIRCLLIHSSKQLVITDLTPSEEEESIQTHTSLLTYTCQSSFGGSRHAIPNDDHTTSHEFLGPAKVAEYYECLNCGKRERASLLNMRLLL